MIQEFFNERFNANLRAINYNGKAYFFASDLAKALEYRKVGKLYEKIEKCDIIQASQLPDFQLLLQNGAIHQRQILVNEVGLIDAIFGSKKKEARAFRRWAVSEVIPAVIKHGGYIREDAAPEKVERLMENLILDRIREGKVFRDNFLQLYGAAPNAMAFSDSVLYIATSLRKREKRFGLGKLNDYTNELWDTERCSDEFDNLTFDILTKLRYEVGAIYSNYLKRSNGQLRRQLRGPKVTEILYASIEMRELDKRRKSKLARKGSCILGHWKVYFNQYHNGTISINRDSSGASPFERIGTLPHDQSEVTLMGYRIVRDGANLCAYQRIVTN